MLHARRIGPKGLYAVKHALVVLENMHNDIYVVYKRPMVTVLGVVWALAAFCFYQFLYILSYRFNLYVGPCLA